MEKWIAWCHYSENSTPGARSNSSPSVLTSIIVPFFKTTVRPKLKCFRFGKHWCINISATRITMHANIKPAVPIGYIVAFVDDTPVNKCKIYLCHLHNGVILMNFKWFCAIFLIIVVTYTPKTWIDFCTTNFGSYLAAFCLLMDRQFLPFIKSGPCSFGFWIP